MIIRCMGNRATDSFGLLLPWEIVGIEIGFSRVRNILRSRIVSSGRDGDVSEDVVRG